MLLYPLPWPFLNGLITNVGEEAVRAILMPMSPAVAISECSSNDCGEEDVCNPHDTMSPNMPCLNGPVKTVMRKPMYAILMIPCCHEFSCLAVS